MSVVLALYTVGIFLLISIASNAKKTPRLTELKQKRSLRITLRKKLPLSTLSHQVLWNNTQSAPIMDYKRFMFWSGESVATDWYAWKVKKHFHSLIIYLFLPYCSNDSHIICSALHFSFSFVWQSWTLFFLHISRILNRGSRHSWVNLKSSEWESATNNCFTIPFAEIIKEKVLSRLSEKGKKLCETDNGSQIGEQCQIYCPSLIDAALETPRTSGN